MDTAGLLKAEEDGWHALLDALARVPQDRFASPTLTPEGWSVKDAVFHVAYWLDDCARVLRSIDAGTFSPEREYVLDIQAINDEGFLRSRGMDSATVVTSLRAARDLAREAFEALQVVTPEAWEWFEESAPLHYRSHMDDLQEWLRRDADPA